MSNELGEEVGYLQVILCCGHLLEVTTVLLGQGASLLLTYLPGVAQVPLVPHQEDRNVHHPVTKKHSAITATSLNGPGA